MPIYSTYTLVDGEFVPLDPKRTAEELVRNGLDASPLAFANSFRTVRGIEDCGIGHILLRRKDVVELLRLDSNNTFSGESFTHKIAFTAGTKTVTVSKLCLWSAVSLSGCDDATDNDIMLCEFRDLRALADFATLDQAYNVETLPLDAYYTGSTNGGSAWTWATLIADIWSKFPSLFGSLDTTAVSFPSHAPENYRFNGVRARDALHRVLRDIRHTLLLSVSGQFSIIPDSLTDAANNTIRNHANARGSVGVKSHSPSFTSPFIPATVRVYFPSRDFAFQNNNDANLVTFNDFWGLTPAYYVNVTTSGILPAATTITGTVATLWSSLQALYDEQGSLQNGAALSAAATALATRYLNSLNNSEEDLHEVYYGVDNVAPHNSIAAVRWGDLGGGMFTEIECSTRERDWDVPPLLSGSSTFPGGPPAGIDSLYAHSTDHPGPPDLGRDHLPYERWAVVKATEYVYAGQSGTFKVLYGTIGGGGGVTWAETSLPHEIECHMLNGQVFVDQTGLAYFDGQTRRWVINGGSFSGIDIVWFELDEDLTPLQSNAQAKLLDRDLVDTGNLIQVFDPYQAPGMWRGSAGYQGIAIRRSGTTGGRPNYNIIWMETKARWIRFTLTADFNLAGVSLAATVDHYHLQGVDPGATVTIYDPNELFFDSIEGCSGTAHYNDRQDRYEVVNCKRAVERGSAVLRYPMCPGEPAEIEADTWDIEPHGDEIFDPGAPEFPRILNTAGHAALAGDTVFVRRIVRRQPFIWEVYNVSLHEENVTLELEIHEGYEVSAGVFRDVLIRNYVISPIEYCEPPDSEILLEFIDECPP